MKIYTVILLALGAMLSGCSDDDRSNVPEIPEFSDPKLVEGKRIWVNTCRNCHLMGIAGAPAISDPVAWKSRQQHGIDKLYSSAIQGIKKNDSWTMPPHGGNDALTENQVRSAVDYMLAAVQALSTKD